MTPTEFNEKYKDFLEKGHYGLAVGDTEFINWLDGKFQKFIEIPNFSYSQIKSKFGMGRFYCEGLTDKQVREVEERISNIEKNN
jgi:hypothetical protein